MKVLVSAASRHGSTAEIADFIGRTLGETLRTRHLDVEIDVRPAEQVTDVDSYDAVVLGSALYMGHWLDPARRLARSQAATLADRAVWLFSSGPVGNPPKPQDDSVDVEPLMLATKAREHRQFSGKIDRQELDFGETATMLSQRLPEGDFRDWAAIQTWTAAIAEAL
jgi:menaquinone-dependent protoporphyrinogen oxidase